MLLLERPRLRERDQLLLLLIFGSGTGRRLEGLDVRPEDARRDGEAFTRRRSFTRLAAPGIEGTYAAGKEVRDQRRDVVVPAGFSDLRQCLANSGRAITSSWRDPGRAGRAYRCRAQSRAWIWRTATE